jgi:hypothetical protein
LNLLLIEGRVCVFQHLFPSQCRVRSPGFHSKPNNCFTSTGFSCNMSLECSFRFQFSWYIENYFSQHTTVQNARKCQQREKKSKQWILNSTK